MVLDLNAVHFDDGPVTETPKVGTVEDWVYINMTGDTHPMHTHLVTFQGEVRASTGRDGATELRLSLPHRRA